MSLHSRQDGGAIKALRYCGGIEVGDLRIGARSENLIRKDRPWSEGGITPRFHTVGDPRYGLKADVDIGSGDGRGGEGEKTRTHIGIGAREKLLAIAHTIMIGVTIG